MYYEPHTFEIKYHCGHMVINAHEFFPASKQRLRKLLKVVSIAEDPDKIEADMLEYIKKQFEDLKATAVKLVKHHQESIVMARNADNDVELQANKVQKLKEYIKATDRKTIREKGLREKLKAERALLKKLKEKDMTLRAKRDGYKAEIRTAERHLKMLMDNMEVLNG